MGMASTLNIFIGEASEPCGGRCIPADPDGATLVFAGEEPCQSPPELYQSPADPCQLPLELLWLADIVKGALERTNGGARRLR